jgi:hypothetical protein
MPDLPNNSTGKIGRLPARLREEVNRRLHDGQSAGQILPWLNAEPDTLKALELYFEGEAISAQNLSAWRNGGFRKWLKQQQDIEETKARAQISLDLAKASGGNLSEGALAMLTGEVLEMVQEFADLRAAGGEIDPKLLTAINKSLIAARGRELESQTLNLNKKKLKQKDRELALAEEKFQLQFCEGFLKWYGDEKVRRIAESGEHKDVKMDRLRQLLFGAPPRKGEEAA